MTDKVRIFVVEDESIVAIDLMNSLRVLGYQVAGHASNGKEAIAKVLETRPDLVLMDIILKGEMDGIETCEAIRARLDIPVIFLTACADEKTLQRAKITEPLGYLLKPFEEWELHGHIDVALYRHRMERKLRESEERYSLATQGSNDGLWDWDLNKKEIFFSPRWKSMLGYADHQFRNSPDDWLNRIHPADKDQVQKLLAQHVLGKSSHFESEYRILDAAGAYRWVLCRGMALRGSDGKAYRLAGSQTDITDRKVYNPLTGLPNRILLIDRLERALGRVKRHQTKAFAVLAVNVDGLKAVKDTLGYVSADQLLVQVAGAVQECLPDRDSVAHCDEGEFVVLQEDVRSPEDAVSTATRIHNRLEKPFPIDGHTVYVSPTTGITLSNGDYTSPDELLRDASTAMRRAKSEGKGRCEMFDQEMRSSAVAHLKLEADFRQALERREIKVYYQPIVCLKTGMLTGFEALVRWQRSGKLMFPVEFLGLAESTDLILPLENWVLLESCRQVAQWQATYGKPLKLNVNLCPKHYSDPHLIKLLKESLDASGLDPISLHLEITETALMENTETIQQTLSRIQEMNIQVHMDDFGTGYSSLSYLHRFPIDALKIDRSFVGKLGMNNETWKITQAIVSLAKTLGLGVTAEGVENLMHVRMLQSLGCDHGQGYYFSRPADANGIEFLMAEQPPWALAFDDNVVFFPFAAEASR